MGSTRTARSRGRCGLRCPSDHRDGQRERTGSAAKSGAFCQRARHGMAQPADLGDKKYVLPSLLPEFAGKVGLIYIDPPFNTDADFSFTTDIPDCDTSLTKQPSMMEQK